MTKEMYKKPYHNLDLSKSRFLITGGAGFIGSNLVEYLIRYNAGFVRVLDNFSNGYLENIQRFIDLPNFELITGDIRDYETCKKAIQNIDYVSHQAALGSVPRSINDPITSNDVNISGFLNMLIVSKESSQLKRFVYAASSSTYGDSTKLPKIEGEEGAPISPYAVTKLVNELYADVFSRVYGIHTIGLRYFNVFGPNQNPNNPYAAVIAKFCQNIIENALITINGDGETSRDFTFVENAINANIKAMFYNDLNEHTVYNVACGESTSLNEIIEYLESFSNKTSVRKYLKERKGDIKHSLACIDKIKNELNYVPTFLFKEGLKITYNNYLKTIN